MRSLNEHLNEAKQSESYWDKQFAAAMKLFPKWQDEKIDLTNSIRKAYNELEIDVVAGDEGYIEMIKKDSNAKKTGDFAVSIWTKLKGNVNAKKDALEDFTDWISGVNENLNEKNIRKVQALETREEMAGYGYPAITKGKKYQETSLNSGWFLDDNEVWKSIDDTLANGFIKEL